MAESNLRDITGLSVGNIELLSAVGVEDLSSLANSGTSAGLREEMHNANEHLRLERKLPTQKQIEAWLEQAREIVGKEAVLEMASEKAAVVPLSELPIAISVKKEQIIQNDISVDEVLVMEKFVEEEEEVEIGMDQQLVRRIKEGRRKKGDVRRGGGSSSDNKSKLFQDIRAIAPNVHSVGKLDHLGQASSENDSSEERQVIEPLQRNAGFDIRKTASPQLNEGKKPHSRSFVRGVLHPQPVRVRIAAFVSLIAFLLLPASILAAVLIISKDALPMKEPLWLLAVPLAFVFFVFLYLTIARPLKCRICGQPLLGRKGCFKHVKAHRIPLLGYIVPTSLHMLLYHWFRCIYCGTSVRLKE